MATQNVSEEQLQSQFTYIDAVARLLGDKRPKAYTHTFGCQQNEADTERIRGMLSEMGYEMTDTPDEADFILFNTCAVREHAEDRAFGNVGALRHLKKERPGIVIAMCGCMAQQEKNVEKIKKSYPQVNLLFGTHALWRFPSLLYRVLTEKKRVFDIGGEDDIAEGLPVLRAKGAKAWLSIMYGCNNFCTYCIVPYVRGRERSRRPEEIEKELRELVAAGYKEITLLGQNVNSYGKDLGIDVDFADLLRRLNAVPGDFWLRFMTSHPKDASPKLFSAMAECDKVAKQLHLPFQSGSDEILHRMNRRYTAAQYLELVDYARKELHAATLYNYSTSFGAYLTLKYMAEIGNPFKKVALRCPGIHMSQLVKNYLSPEEMEKLEKGKEVQVGYERKMKMDKQFVDDLEKSDVRKYEYFDWADDMLILHGTKDKLAPIEDSQEFAENNVITFIPVENANHTFSDPKTSDFAAHTIVEFFGPEK